MFQDVTVEELLELQKKRELALVDVRSSGEFGDFTIPGSVNIPLFTDAERAEIGTIYKQQSMQAAKDRGLEIVSAKLPAFIRSFEAIEPRKAVYCWRGGMRSRTTATLLSLMGIRVYRLTGGIRAYRQWVVDQLEHMEIRQQVYVIRGNTGTGKTKLLQQLAERGYPVLDLEGMAAHRGSIFGQIGLQPHNQKTFDSLLLKELLELHDRPLLLIEAESQRVGRVVLPDFIMRAKERGQPIDIILPLEKRIDHILDDYKPQLHQQECIEAYSRIKRRIHTPIAAEIEQHLQNGRFPEAVRLLLEHYYDPRYEHAEEKYDFEPIRIEAKDSDEALEQMIQLLAESKP